METPALDRTIVEYLDKLFPEHSPEPEQSFAQIMYEAGKRAVVRHLLVKLELQEAEDVPTTP